MTPSRNVPSAAPVRPVSMGGLRARLAQLKPDSISMRNRAFSAPACLVGQDRVFVWQDSPSVRPVGELHCRLGTDEFFLAAHDLSMLEPRLLGFESFVASEACTSLVEHAFAPILDLIETFTGQPVNCEAFRRIPPRSSQETTLQIGFVLSGTRGQAEVRGWIRAPLSFWRGLDFSRGVAAPSARYQAVPLGFALRLGHCRMPASELQQLAIGDALRITPKLSPGASLPVHLVHTGGSFGCHARVARDQLTMETLMNTTMNTAPPTSPRPQVVAPPAAPLTDEGFLSTVRCELSFELGSMSMSLAEISKLRVGQALRLGVNLQEQPVHILSSGREIARGELAAVGDELVVVVTETRGLPPG